MPGPSHSAAKNAEDIIHVVEDNHVVEDKHVEDIHAVEDIHVVCEQACEPRSFHVRLQSLFLTQQFQIHCYAFFQSAVCQLQ